MEEELLIVLLALQIFQVGLTLALFRYIGLVAETVKHCWKIIKGEDLS